MGAIAAIIGGIGGLCAVMGIITATGTIQLVMPQFTWQFWFALSVILLLACITFALGRGGGYE